MSWNPKDAILVPVKTLSEAKQRLAGVLTAQERHDLVRLMLEGVLTVLAAEMPEAWRWMVTSDGEAAELGRAHGFEILEEGPPQSESASVDHACRQFTAMGIRGSLRIPLDLPLLGPYGVEDLVAAIPPSTTEAHPQALLVPDVAGTGTNALYRSPAAWFPSRFGPDSLRLHQQEAIAHGGELSVLELPELALDLDTPADLQDLLSRGVDCPAVRLLREWGLPERLEKL